MYPQPRQSSRHNILTRGLFDKRSKLSIEHLECYASHICVTCRCRTNQRHQQNAIQTPNHILGHSNQHTQPGFSVHRRKLILENNRKFQLRSTALRRLASQHVLETCIRTAFARSPQERLFQLVLGGLDRTCVLERSTQCSHTETNFLMDHARSCDSHVSTCN
jgi:hypothetical protein